MAGSRQSRNGGLRGDHAPVLTIGAEFDRTVNPRVPRTTATKYRQGTYVEIPRSDHLVFVGESLPVTMSRIDDWMARNRVLSAV
jgi:hypothetical protein